MGQLNMLLALKREEGPWAQDAGGLLKRERQRRIGFPRRGSRRLTPGLRRVRPGRDRQTTQLEMVTWCCKPLRLWFRYR